MMLVNHPRAWRLIPLSTASGPTNMAVDEAILESVARREVPATLRFYSWDSPWLSIGCAQRLDQDILVDRAAEAGFGLLRRPSGGTAVLHDDQVAFSLVLPDDHPLANQDIVESYQLLGEPVARALRALGVPARALPVVEARATPADPGGRLACFGSLSPYEAVVDGEDGRPRKLVGHGQLRRRGVVMHHAVISRRFAPAALASLLRVPDHDVLAALLGRTIADLAEFGLGARDVAVANAIVAAFADASDASIEPGALTPAEEDRVSQLVSEKYGSAEWLRRL